LAGEDTGEWSVVGLVESRSELLARDVWMRVRLEGSGGEVLAESVVRLAIAHLGPGEVAPFAAALGEIDSPTAAVAEVARYSPDDFERPQIEVGELSTAAMPDGRVAVLGEIENLSSEPIEVHEIAIAVAGADGGLVSVVPASAHRERLDPGARGAFLALLPPGPEASVLTPYVDATIAGASPPSRLELVEPPALLEDERGSPLVVGVIRNGGSRLGWASVLVALRADGELMGVAQLAPPVPLGPGESRAFAAGEFPGLAERWPSGEGIEALSLEAWIDPVTPERNDLRLLPLAVDLESYEGIGGRLFLRGTVQNPLDEAVQSPTVLATLRSIEGQPLTAGWLVVAEGLGPGESADWVLALSLPRGTDLAMSEYDIVSLGLAPQRARAGAP
jgi:hypothetical protein